MSPFRGCLFLIKASLVSSFMSYLLFKCFRFCFVIMGVVFTPFNFVCVSDLFELFLGGVGVGVLLYLFYAVQCWP